MTLSFGLRNAAVLSDLSAAARFGDTLFVGNDETASIYALVRSDNDWKLDQVYPLSSLISLPGGAEDEVDIEALDVHGGYLWLTGSHALVRRKIKDVGKKALRRAYEIERPPNRFVLARIPIVERKGRGVLVSEHHHRRAQQLESGKRSSTLIKWIDEDSLLSPFLELPSKENGFDIEGLAVSEDATWLGLRGPVIRGFAIVLQLHLSGAKRGALKAKKLDDGRRFRKYLLPLSGLGVRDMAVCGDDLLILAGPTMDAAGPAYLVRWKGATRLNDSQVIDRNDLNLVKDLSAQERGEKAEGLAIWSNNQALIVHDNPSPARADRVKGIMQADLVDLT